MTSGLAKYLNRERITKEFWGLFRYGVVGGTSMVIHVGIYTLLSRLVWQDGNRTVQYVIALTLASLFNFTFHRMWTFAVKAFSARMIGRYATVVLTSMAVQSVLFYIGHELLGIYDFVVFFSTAGLAALMQYFGHRFFTYNTRFEKQVVVTETHEHTIGTDFETQRDSVEVRMTEEGR